MRFCNLLVPSLLAWVVVAAGAASVGAEPAGPGARMVPAATMSAETPRTRVAALRRVLRGLETPLPASSAIGLRIDTDLEVFGAAPAREWLDHSDLVLGAPTYGSPTHDDLLTVVTPPALRSTAATRRLRPTWALAR